MLIGLIYLTSEFGMPHFVNLSGYLFDNLIIWVVILFGIALMLRAVGVIIPNPGPGIMRGVSQVIVFLLQTIYRALRWLLRAFIRTVPRIYHGNQMILGRYFTPVVAKRLATLVTAIWVVIII